VREAHEAFRMLLPQLQAVAPQSSLRIAFQPSNMRTKFLFYMREKSLSAALTSSCCGSIRAVSTLKCLQPLQNKKSLLEEASLSLMLSPDV